jgi:hypothetical protein
MSSIKINHLSYRNNKRKTKINYLKVKYQFPSSIGWPPLLVHLTLFPSDHSPSFSTLDEPI